MTLWNDQTSRRNRPGTLDERIDLAEVAADALGEDGQPLSRRAARERERRAAESLAAGQQHPSGVLDFGGHGLVRDLGADESFDAHSTADIWEALSRRAEETPMSVTAGSDADTPAAASIVDDAAVRAPGVRRRGRRAVAADAGAAAVDAPAVDDQVSDGSTAGVADAFAAPIDYPVSATGGQPAIAPVTDDLIERVREAVLGRDRSADVLPAEHPLTRREMRAQQSAETVDGMPAAWFAGDADATPAVNAPAAFSGVSEERASDDHDGYLDVATVQMSAVDRAALAANAPMTAPVDLPQLFSQPIGRDEIAFSSPVLPVAAEPIAAHPDAVAAPTFVEPEAQVAPVEADEDRTDLAGFEALISRSRGRTPQVPPAAQIATTQTGSTRQVATPAWQAPQDADDQHAGFAGLLSRNVGLAHGSQNALIMAQDPQPDITKAVTGTGELFITGSLNLSRRLATTGATPQHYDALEIDRLFEASQDEPAANVAPVRASRAISSSGTGRSISPRRTRSSALPMVLAVVAGVMALGVIGLIVGSRLAGIF